jgi:hypothetical protein
MEKSMRLSALMQAYLWIILMVIRLIMARQINTPSYVLAVFAAVPTLFCLAWHKGTSILTKHSMCIQNA